MIKEEIYLKLASRFGEDKLRDILDGLASHPPKTRPKHVVQPARAKDRSYRDAVAEFILSSDPHYFVTFCLNRAASIEETRAAAELIYKRLQNRRFGKKCQPASAYDVAWFFVEKLSTNAHFHCFWHLNSAGIVSLDRAVAKRPWKRQLPSLTSDLKILHDGPAVNYSVKAVCFDAAEVLWFDSKQWTDQLVSGGN